MQNEVEVRAYHVGDTPGNALDALLEDLLAQQSETVYPAARDISLRPVYSKARQTRMLIGNPVAGTSVVNDRDPDDLHVNAEAPSEMAPVCALPFPLADEPEPAQTATDAECVYRAADLTLFERLTGYQLVQRGRVWRSADGEGNRPPASDRLFTVLAEEAFGLADRRRRNRGRPDLDLSAEDIAATVGSLHDIAAHLDTRGIAAADRLEIAVLAALDQQMAA